jgi:hypothetical protein
MKVSCTLHFALPTQRAQYPPNHPWNGHRCSQVLVWRLGGAQALGCMASDDASLTMLLKSVDEGCAPYTPWIGTIQSSPAMSGLSSIRHAQEVLAPEDVGRSGRGKRVELWQGGPGLPRTLMTQ